MINRSLQILARPLLLALLYFVTGRLGLMLPAFGSNITLVWLPSGIAVAALLRCGFGCWPGVMLGALAVDLTMGGAWPTALGIAAGNTAGPLLTAWILRRMDFHAAFDRQRDILLLAAAAALGMLVPASLGVPMLALAGGLPTDRLFAWLIWWGGDIMGVIAAAPLLLAFNRQEWRAISFRRVEFLIWICATGLIVLGVFVLNPGPKGQALALAFLPLPLVAWAALRFGAIGTSLALIGLSVGAAYATSHGRGPLHLPDPIEEVVVLWLFMATSAVLGWLITALHTARLEATRIQSLFEQALSDVSLGVMLGDLDRKITYANTGFTRLTGYTEAELLGQSCRILQGPESDPVLAGKIRAALSGDGYFDGEILNYRKDGTAFWNGLLISPVHNERGKRTGFLAIQRNISKRRQAEDALREAHQKLRLHFEQAPMAVIEWDLDFRVARWNPAAETIFGFSHAEALGRHAAFIVPEVFHPHVDQIWQALMRKSGGERSSNQNVRKDGLTILCEWYNTPLIDERGTCTGVASLVQDITLRTQAEAARASLEVQLRESQKMEAIGTLAGGVAHDFNNALATILGNVELARLDMSANPLVLESLEEIRSAGKRARDLVQQILSFSRRQPTERKLIWLAPVVGESVRLLRATLPARLTIEVHCEPDMPPVLADATQIQQVVLNLATNAMQAIPGGTGRIGVRVDTVRLEATLAEAHPALRALHAQSPGRTVRLAVSDDGPGMDAAILGRIFEPFFTTKPVGEGTGLGLSVVHGIVQAHEGVITVESQPGQGATFTLYLPAAAATVGGPAPDASVVAATATPDRGSGQHILYLDDDESLVFLVRRLLGRRGYRISGYTDQSAALKALGADPAGFDLVVTDYNMPGLSGLEVARAVRAIRADLPVAVTSGFIDEELRAQAGGAGVRELIFKAKTVEDLCEVVQRLAQKVAEKPPGS